MAAFKYAVNTPQYQLVQQIVAYLAANDVSGTTLTDSNGNIVVQASTPNELGIALGTTPHLFSNVIDIRNTGASTTGEIEVQSALCYMYVINPSTGEIASINTAATNFNHFYSVDGTSGNRLGIRGNVTANLLELYTAGAEITITAAGAITISKPITSYNGLTTAGLGVPVILGVDNRKAIATADGSAITLYTTVSATGLFRVTCDILVTAYTSGTATYTITWTQNAQTQTIAVSATVVNTLGTATKLINPDTGTAITVQLTGTFVATVDVAAVVEQLAA